MSSSPRIKLGNEVVVNTLPCCDFCEENARFDAKMNNGMWANLCLQHWMMNTDMQLGQGKGQNLVLPGEL